MREVRRHSLASLTTTITNHATVCGQKRIPVALQEWCMSRKKNHEVAVMGNVIAALGLQHNASHVVDLGSGKGYLSSYLTSAHAMTVLGIESAAQNNHRAESRYLQIERASRARSNRATRTEDWVKQTTSSASADPSPGSMVVEGANFQTLTAKVDQDFDLRGALAQAFNADVDKVIVCGLHACGDLTPSALRLYVRCPQSKVLCLIGCCYHLIEEEFPEDGDSQFCFIYIAFVIAGVVVL